MNTTPPALLPILRAPHPALSVRCRDVAAGDAVLVISLVDQMKASMYAAKGIGLAAPQVGLPIRLAVVDVHPDGVADPIVLINPRIVWASEETALRNEGCLSLPGEHGDVRRPAAVMVEYKTVTGRLKRIEATGLLSVCLQHEIDHLDGILFTDRMAAMDRSVETSDIPTVEDRRAA